MPDSDPSRAEETPEFRSPKRALARSFRLSRDRWKQKATQRREEIKALQIRVRDLETSRDLWKEKALYLQAQLQQLQGLALPQTSQTDPPDNGQPPPAPGSAPSSTTTEAPTPKKAPRARP